MRRQFLQRRFHQLFVRIIAPIERYFKRCLQPAIIHPTLGAVMDVTRSQSELIAENAFLPQQFVDSMAAYETPHAHPLGSWTARLVRQPTDGMQGCAAQHQARHAAPLASTRFPLVLALQVQSQDATTACPCTRNCAHPHHGTRPSLVGCKTYSWCAAEIGLSPDETHRRQLHPPGSLYSTPSTTQSNLGPLSEESCPCDLDV